MVLHELPANITDARNAVAQLRNHPSLLVWMLPSRSSAADLHGMVEAIRKLDASRSIGRILEPNEPLDSMGPVDLLLLPIGHPAIGSNSLGKPYIVTANTPAPPSSPAEFEARMTAIRDSHGSPPGLVGVIL